MMSILAPREIVRALDLLNIRWLAGAFIHVLGCVVDTSAQFALVGRPQKEKPFACRCTNGI
jgi:hypothetical protein